MEIKEQLIDEEKYTSLRREFHQIPELGLKEYETFQLILSTLKSLFNFEKYAKMTKVGDTGLFIDISGQGQISENYESMKISLRADIDGLPLQELNDIPYKSKHDGFTHGCGHDGHTTILIATMEFYLTHIELIPRNFTVRFLFQPSEENIRGALTMIKGGCLEGVSEIYGLHNDNSYKVGEFVTCKGVILARTDIFDINITGKGGHSSTPYLCKSPINTGVKIITAMNQIGSQEMDPADIHALGIGAFQSGEANNVIPEKAVIRGTVRSLQSKTGEKVMNRIREICKNIGTMNQCEITVDLLSGPATINTEKETDYILEIINQHYKLSTLGLPSMGSEDFAFYLEKVPGCYFYLGTMDENHPTVDFHSPKFDYNDVATPLGVEMFIRIIEHRAKVRLLK